MKLFALCASVLAFSAALASCQKEKATLETSEVHVFHVELDATVTDTKATYATASKQITFESGDALYVALTQPTSAEWSAATGTLTYDGTSFKGNITYTGTYSGSDIITDAKDLTATFLPKNYGTVNYLSATGTTTATNAFYAGSKDAAVPQLVHLTASVSDKAGVAKSPLALVPNNAVLFYTIPADNLSAGAHGVSVSNGNGTTINGLVTAVAGNATTFAVAFPADAFARTYTMSIPGYTEVAKSGKTLTAGKVSNISTGVDNAPLPGVFSVSSTQTVKFSKGNLQAVFASAGTSCTWQFAANQWDYIGNAAANTNINGNGSVSASGTVDLFGWSTSATDLGIHNSLEDDIYTGDFVDWGSSATVQAGIGAGWSTLSSWGYLLSMRSVTYRYCKATVNNITGMVIFPDSYSHPEDVPAPADINTNSAAFTINTWSAADWAKMEMAGSVFLPTAGTRVGTSVISVGTSGNYWTSTPSTTEYVYYLSINENYMSTSDHFDRKFGHSVRLVQNQ